MLGMGGVYGKVGDPAGWRSEANLLELKRLAIKKGGATLKKGTDYILTPPTGEPMSNFVPENLVQWWSTTAARERHIVASKVLRSLKREATSTRVLVPVVTKYGGRRYQPHSFAENGVLPGTNSAEADQRPFDLKLFGDRRALSHLVPAVGMVGGVNPGGPPMVQRNGLHKITGFMIREQALEYERAVLHADSDVDPLEFDGLIKQIEENGLPDINVVDLRGEPLTFELLIEKIAQIANPDYFAATTQEVWVSDSTWATLITTTADGGRWTNAGGEMRALPQGWTYNPKGMWLIGPAGQEIQIKIIPYLAGPVEFPTVATNTPAQAVTIANMTSSAAAPDSDSQFDADDAGTYKVGVVAVFGQGASAGFFTTNIVVAAGDVITIIMNDAAIGTADNPLKFYEWWLTDNTGETDTATYGGRVPVKNVSGHTEFVIDNSTIAGTDCALALQFEGEAIWLSELFPSMRFPIYSPIWGYDMILANCSTPVVAHHEQQILFKNVRRLPTVEA